MKWITLSEIAPVAVSHNAAIHKKMMLAPGELPPLVQFSQAVIPPGEVVEAHSHESMHEVFFVQQGQGVIKVDGNEFRVEPGSCLLAEAGERHALQTTGDEPLVMLFFGIAECGSDE